MSHASGVEGWCEILTLGPGQKLLWAGSGNETSIYTAEPWFACTVCYSGDAGCFFLFFWCTGPFSSFSAGQR